MERIARSTGDSKQIGSKRSPSCVDQQGDQYDNDAAETTVAEKTMATMYPLGRYADLESCGSVP